MMQSLLDFLSANARGIVLLLLLVLCAVLCLQWVTWLFSRGRFKSRKDPVGGGKPLRFVFADLLVKIIDDFRHLLALVIVVIFAVVLTYALVLVAYEPTGRLDGMSKALQAVVSSLGGLIGAIIGYYFGEKAGEKGALAKAAGAAAAQPAPLPGPAEQVEPAPEPPEQKP